MRNNSYALIAYSLLLLTGCARTELAPFEVGNEANIISISPNGEAVFGPRVAQKSYAPVEESPKNKSYEKPISVKEQSVDDDLEEDRNTPKVPVVKQTKQTTAAVSPIPQRDLMSDEIKPQAAKTVKRNTQYTGKTVNNGSVIVKFGDVVDGYKSDGMVIKAPLGTNIHSILDGEVIYAGSQLKEYGNIVVVKHQNDLISTYAHLQKTLVNKGDIIKAGSLIGTVGKSGDVKFPQLYIQLMKNSSPINPAKYVKL